MKRTALAFLLVGVLANVTVLSQAAAASSPETGRARAVSLKVLQARLKVAVAKRQQPAELLTLCGLTRISGYVVDDKTRDLILLGEVEAGAPALRLEDLAVALRSAWMRHASRRGNVRYYSNPGCSIDPSPDVIARLRDLGDSAEGRGADMADRMDEWCESCSQPQQVRVMGVPFDSHFARVMVDADYLMKRLVDGSLRTKIAGFASLTDLNLTAARTQFQRDGTSGITRFAMNRFWFYPGKVKFQDEEGLATIEECPVILLTEEQHLTREGIAGQGRPDPMAQRFADSFSAHYAEIAAAQPVYQQLEELFRLVALGRLLQYQGVQADLDYLMNRFPVPEVKVDRTLPGIALVNRIETRRQVADGEETMRLWLPTCGGVSMDLKVGPQNLKRVPPKKQTGRGAKPASTKKGAILKKRPAPDSLYWDIGALGTRG